VFSLDLKLLRSLFSSRRLEYHAIFPEKFVLGNIIRIRDNLRMNYPLKCPDYLFVVGFSIAWIVSCLEIFQCLWTRGEMKSDLDEVAKFERRFLKAFLHPPPPL